MDGLYMMLGDAAKELTITKEMFSRWEDDSGSQLRSIPPRKS